MYYESLYPSMLIIPIPISIILTNVHMVDLDWQIFLGASFLVLAPYFYKKATSTGDIMIKKEEFRRLCLGDLSVLSDKEFKFVRNNLPKEEFERLLSKKKQVPLVRDRLESRLCGI